VTTTVACFFMINIVHKIHILHSNLTRVCSLPLCILMSAAIRSGRILRFPWARLQLSLSHRSLRILPTLITVFYLFKAKILGDLFPCITCINNKNTTHSGGKIRRLLREQHVSEDPTDKRTLLVEEAEAVPVESEVSCRSVCKHSVKIRMEEGLTSQVFTSWQFVSNVT
jgi:hypothetical protein